MGLQDIEDAYRTYFPLIRAKCARMLLDPMEAEDVAQETFIRLWIAKVAGDFPSAIASWVYKTSTRLAIDRLRHRDVVNKVRPSTPTCSVGPHGQVEAAQLLERLATTAEPRELHAALLHRCDGVEQSEIAEILEISVRTVRRLLTRFDARVSALDRQGVQLDPSLCPEVVPLRAG